MFLYLNKKTWTGPLQQRASRPAVYLTRQLQSVLNAATRLLYRLKTGDHITDHWCTHLFPLVAGSRTNTCTVQAGCSDIQSMIQSVTQRRTALP